MMRNKRTYEIAVMALSTVGAFVQPQHWGMLLSGGVVLVTLIELLVPDAYDTKLRVTFSEDGDSWDTIG